MSNIHTIDPRNALKSLSDAEAVEYLIEYTNNLLRKDQFVSFVAGYDLSFLTNKQMQILQAIYSKRVEYASASYLYDAVYGLLPPDKMPVSRVLEVQILKIRRKFKAHNIPIIIENAKGIGYRIVEDGK